MFVTAKNSFFLKSDNSNHIVFTGNDDEILNLQFNKTYQNIDKILLKMKIERLDLANNHCKL